MREGWVETTLGEVASLQMGRTPSRRESKYWTSDLTFPFCTIADMNSKFIDPQREGVTRSAIEAGKAKVAKKGTLLMSFKLTIGRMGFAARDIFPNEAIVMIESDKKIVLDHYLYLRLASMDLTKNSGKAVKGLTLNSGSIASISFSVPPLPEQKRIVDLISSVDSYIEALQQQIDKTNKSRNAVTSKIFENNNLEWVDYRLGEILDIARGGSPRPIQNFLTDAKDGINWLKISDASLSKKYIYKTEQRIKPEGVFKSRRVYSGDFVLSNSMSFGRPYIMKTDACIHDGWLLLSNVKNHFDEDFLYNLLNSNSVQSQFNSLAAGSGVRNLNIDVVKKVVVRIPTKQLQTQLCVPLNVLDEYLVKLNQLIHIGKNLRSALLSDLLSGNHEIPSSYDKLIDVA